MKKNGFTLTELLVIIILISLVTAIAVPSTITISNRIKQKLLNEKLELAKSAAVLWSEENNYCFTPSKPCSFLTYVTVNSSDITVKIKIGRLAEDGLFSYDDKVKKIIENPVDNTDLSSKEITIIYNIKSKSARSTL